MKMNSYKIMILLAATLVVTACSKKLRTVNQSGVIRVMSYNVRHCSPPSKPTVIDVDGIANVIAKENPDVVALQEVDVNTNRSGKLNEAVLLAEKLKMNFFFAKAIDHDGGDYGVAILSKYKISNTNIQRLTTVPDTKGEPRVLATVVLTLPNGKKIKFGCTHLDAQKVETNRILQTKEIVAFGEKEKLPLIIAGDLNSRPGSNPINIIDGQYVRTCEQCAFTIPVVTPRSTIDFIAYNKTSPFQVVAHKVVQEHYASDHLPIVAELKIKSE